MSEQGLAQARYEVERLLELSGCFTFLMDEEQILSAVLREFSDMEVDRCVVSVFEDVEDRDPAWLQVVAAYDRESTELGMVSSPTKFNLSEMPIVGRLLVGKEPIVIADIEQGKEIQGLTRQRLWLHGIRAVAIVPLVVMGWPIGMLVVGRQAPGDFSASDLRFYQIVAGLAAMALRAVHLIQAQERRMAEQNAVNRVGQAISSVIQWDELLEVVYRQINTVIEAGDFYIALYDPFHDEVSFPYAVEAGQKVKWADRQAGRGLTGYVLKTRRPLLLPDHIPERLQELGVEVIGKMCHSWIGAPMTIGDQVIGMMAAQDYQRENAYSQADLDLLAALANQVAVAVENARLYREVSRQAVYLRLGAEVGRRIILILDTDELLLQVVGLIRESFGYYHVQVALVDEKTQQVVYRAGSSESGVSHGAEFPRVEVGKEGIIGWVAGQGQPLLVNDVRQDHRYLHVEALPDTRSELAVPIKFGSRVIGVLDVESNMPNAFHPQDVPVIYTLADQIAIALENARLFSERQQRIRELDVLVNIGQSLCSVTSLVQLLDLVREQVGKLIDVSNVFVALYEPQTATVHLEMAYDNGKRLGPFALHYDAGEGLTSWVIENRRPLLIRDWKQDNLGLAQRVVKRGTMDTRSWLGVPIMHCDRVLGVIGVQSAEPVAFDDRHETILTVVAAQLALALGSLPAHGR